ncbi:MAG TPA: hypothetical protein PKE15_00120 [Ottowia sp.]|nr:hypothetical protein [Ottowia sp.]
MGTASIKKFIRNNAGALTEEAALLTSAGAADADRVPALNAAGVLDASIVNAKSTSAGAADAGKLAALDGSGRLDTTMMPVGMGADTKSIQASEALSAGDFVNVHNSGGARVRKADATTAGKEAHGFVLAAVASGANGTVYFEGANSGVSGQTPGNVFLSTTPGAATSTAPSAAGNVVQRIGFAVAATEINFQSQPPVTLA